MHLLSFASFAYFTFSVLFMNSLCCLPPLPCC